MFQDEARFERISDARRCGCPRPMRPLCHAMVTQEYTYAYAAASVLDGQLDTLILPHVNGHCMQLFLDEVASRHPGERIVMALDGAGWHRSESLTLPPYSPELSPVEHLWDDLRESLSIIASSTVSTPWKIIWKSRYAIWNLTTSASVPSSLGRGLLTH